MAFKKQRCSISGTGKRAAISSALILALIITTALLEPSSRTSARVNVPPVQESAMRADSAVNIASFATNSKFSSLDPDIQYFLPASPNSKAQETSGRLNLTASTATAAHSSRESAKSSRPRVQPLPPRFAALNIEFNSAESANKFTAPGVKVFNRFDRFADVFIRQGDKAIDVIKSIVAMPSVVRVELAEAAVQPPPPKPVSGPASKAIPEKIVRGGTKDLSGKGVIIAILDSGVDFRNPDFINYDSTGKPTSRLLYLWDVYSPAYDRSRGKVGLKPPISYPNRASVGTIYNQKQLTAALRTGSPRIADTDRDGHGTACAGVAAGNGNNSKPKPQAPGQPPRQEVIGVAPDADIIAVKLGDEELTDVYLINAVCGWLDRMAGAKPLVISCSFGIHRGSHDGQSVEERQLDARFPEHLKGRALVVAAGNEGGRDIHGETSFKDQNAPGELSFNCREDTPLELYFDAGSLDDLYIASDESTEFKITEAGINPITNRAWAFIRILKTSDANTAKIYLFNKSGRDMKVDAFLSTWWTGATFDSSCATPVKLLRKPGSASSAITVASYDWNDQFSCSRGAATIGNICVGGSDDVCGTVGETSAEPMKIGDISCYSSSGFVTDKSVKPDVAAPGEVYHASYARVYTSKGEPVSGVKPDMHDVDGSDKYALHNGTSAAAPYTAGVIALMFEKKRDLKLGDVRRLLKENVSRSRITGEVPNPIWGFGKLDLNAVEQIIASIK